MYCCGRGCRIERPFYRPLGTVGAVIALSIASVTLFTLFINPDYRRGIDGCAVWFGLGLLYFALYGRRHRVYAPEKAFVVSAPSATQTPTAAADAAGAVLMSR